MIAVHRAVFALSVALGLCASALAQTDPPPALDPNAAPRRMGVVAKVNGEVITRADLDYFARGLSDVGGVVTPEFENEMRRTLSERVLLASEAERLGLALNEYQVDQQYERFFAFKPPYSPPEEVGLPLERQKALVRSLIYAELYVLHRVGMDTAYMNVIPADPLLSRMLDVTPAQLKRYYRENPQAFERPESVAFSVWPCNEMGEALAVLEQLEAGEEPEQPARIQSLMAVDDVRAELSAVPGVVELLLGDELGVVGGPFKLNTDAGLQVLVMRPDERRPAELLPFNGEVQRDLERQIMKSQLELARAETLEQLRKDARSVYWPADLFDKPTAPRPPAQPRDLDQDDPARPELDPTPPDEGG